MADKLRKASATGVANIGAVAAPRDAGVTTLSIKPGGLTNWATSTSVDFSTYRIDGGQITAKVDWTGKVDMDNGLITDLEVTNGTDTGSQVDDIVICVETAAWVNDLVDTLLTVFDKSGVIKANSIPTTALVNSAVTTVKLADSAVTPEKMSATARQNNLDIDGTTEVVFSTAAVQPAAQPGKTIIWFAPA